jgi:hypothetical protein
MEGTACYNPATGCNDGTLVLPILEYLHGSGDCSITGGYAYRGAAIPELAGLLPITAKRRFLDEQPARS